MQDQRTDSNYLRCGFRYAGVVSAEQKIVLVPVSELGEGSPPERPLSFPDRVWLPRWMLIQDVTPLDFFFGDATRQTYCASSRSFTTFTLRCYQLAKGRIHFLFSGFSNSASREFLEILLPLFAIAIIAFEIESSKIPPHLGLFRYSHMAA